MVVTIFIVIISIVLAYAFIPKLQKNNETKTIVIFSIFLLIGTALNIGIALNLKIPSPIDLITFIFTPIKEFIVSLSK
ncbi:hypothetical protein [Lysinibacillus sp. G4S2]|uniref:hypothetical protein n=1 Tax=Lysinibacillus sp. G4S2 TaxID=3055859 RepID=UPI0025A237E9|nr:hypothetical protein [Lysinibacillus sp. G4S2]MDM5248497.1 hypothetical protein [Lysinibacillus sp. G4S2]